MKTVACRKRRAFEEAQELELYRLFMSMDSATAWRTLREPRPTTPIEDPRIWHDYAEPIRSAWTNPHPTTTRAATHVLLLYSSDG